MLQQTAALVRGDSSDREITSLFLLGDKEDNLSLLISS